MNWGSQARAVTFIRVPAWADERTAQYEDWYDQVHIPLRMRQPGFLGAQRYETVLGRQRYFVLYELADPAATESPEYLALRSWEASQPPDSFEAPATSRPGFERGIYDQVGGPSWPDPALIAPVLHVAGYQPAIDQEGDFQEWLSLVHAPRVRAVDGVTAVRVFALTRYNFEAGAIRTQMHTPYPRLVILSYLSDESLMNEPAFVEAENAARALEHQPEREPYVMVGRLAHSAHGESD